MIKYKIVTISLAVFALLGTSSCMKDLDVKNPNSPTLDQASTEPGIISLALGSVYLGGFNGVNLGPVNPLGDSYFMVGEGFHELLADNVNSQNANQNYNVLNVPDQITMDDNSVQTNSSKSIANMRINNSRDKRNSNVFYYEWAYMYALNNGMNAVLSTIPAVTFSGDAATKTKTLQAWAYFWKGFAYSRIGSVYYAGLINNVTNNTNNHYVSHDAMISESNRYFNLALATLAGITSTADYTTVLSTLIPNFVQSGNGGVMTPTQWSHTINTMLARNILANKLTSAMTTADWTAISTLVANGVQASDPVFTGGTASINGFMSLTGGSTAATTAGNNAASNFKISERLIQEYKSGDNRMAENFSLEQYLNSAGGTQASTRYKLVSGGNSVTAPAGTNLLSYVLANNTTIGAYQLIIASSYEENELMKAEALIKSGQIDLGLASVDNVRKFQGAGLAAVSGTGLALAAALEELRRERRVALIFRGTAFYDARRWGVIYDISQGGGRTNAVVLSSTGTVNTHAIINYDFLDYWDVPADESVINPPASGSAAIVNPLH